MREYLDFEKPIAEIEEKIEKLTAAGQERPGVQDDLRKLREKLYKLQAEIYAGLTPWQRTQAARHPQRPSTLDYIGRICDSFLELHGDRLFGDDQAIVAGGSGEHTSEIPSLAYLVFRLLLLKKKNKS